MYISLSQHSSCPNFILIESETSLNYKGKGILTGSGAWSFLAVHIGKFLVRSEAALGHRFGFGSI
jgi:hypothetical protein